MLCSAALEIGGVQIQNRGTIGGNIANGSPAGDSLPVLAAVDAQVVLKSRREERRVPFSEYYTGLSRVGPPARRADHRRRDRGHRGQAVVPQGRDPRGPGHLQGGDGRCARGATRAWRSAAWAPTVVRLAQVEDALAAGRSIDEAVALLERDIRPIDDLRSSATYRAGVAANLLRRFWQDTAA